jgi:plasmid stabilization system protein ParE
LPAVALSREALATLGRLTATHDLPADTLSRVKASIVPLGQFPEMGRSLGERAGGLRLLVGPWDWLLLVYEFLELDDLVVIVSVHDTRTASAPLPEDS